MNPLTFLILTNFISCLLTVNAMKMQLKSAYELRKISSSDKKIPKNNKIAITEYSQPGKSQVIKYFYSIENFIIAYICVKGAPLNNQDFEIWPNGIIYYEIDTKSRDRFLCNC